MRYFIFLLLAVLLMQTVSNSQSLPPVEPGVSKPLAEWRAAHYSNISYKLNITLEKMAPLMKGEIEIFVTLDEEGSKNDLVLDWRTTAFQNDKDKPYAKVVGVNGATDIRVSFPDEHIRIPANYLKKGENKIKIQFASPIKTSGSAITRYIDKEDGSEYIYSLFVPSDASTAFPCFDQPDLKARFQLLANVVGPYPNRREFPDWSVISNSKAGIVTSTWGKLFWFEETKPISTYVFAFAAGDFAEIDCSPMSEAKIKNGQAPGPTLQTSPNGRIYVRKSQAEKFKPHAAEVFRLNRESVKFFEEYFDYKFPFPKYDLVLIPEFPFGGMEHAGATFLRESAIIFPSEPTKNDYISRANLIFHEAAHQWFGDTVTMKWFDDLWLKEGFATFAGYKAMERIMPEYNAWKVFYERTKQAAYQTDSTKGTTPIYQEIPNLSAAKSAYGNIVYNKAPAFLRQAEFYLGEKEFQTAVRSFLKKHEFKNATWQALVSEFELAGKQDLKSWASAWVTKRGLPIVRVKNGDLRRYRHVPEKNNAMMHDTAEVYWYEQADALGQNGIWPFKVKPLLRNGSYDKVKDVTVTEARSNHFESYWVMIVNSPNRTVKTPEFVFPNYGDYGYGIFLLDPKSRAYVLKNIQNEKDDFLRAMMWGSLWDSVREAELDPKEYVELAIKNIHIETDVTTIQTVLGRVSTAMNYYLSDKDANTFAPRLEELLLARIKNSETLGERITYYRALLNNARGEEAVSFLKKLVRGDVFIGKPNSSIEASESQVIIVGTHLPALRTKDKFDIVTRLAILGDPDALKLLDELKSKETSDDAKRYAYAIGAGFGTKEAKEKYFNDFVNNKEISESWIEDAFRPFNSALHSELTLQYLERALKELPNHKRNRKIFFVNGWLGAFIGGQRSEEALAIVNKFLADNPNLDKDLRLKILENADVIERAVKIRRTFGVD